MKLSAPWHRKAASPRVRGSASAPGSLADGAPIEDALATAIAGLRGVIAHVRSAEVLSDLSGDVDALARSSPLGSAAADTDALVNLDQRIAAIADGIAALRVENRRRAAQNFETVIEVLSEKIELLQAAQNGAVNSPGPPRPVQPRPELHRC